MKPPICVICGKRFSPGTGDIIYFKETEEVKEWNKKMEREGKVGHPINAEWFCNEHLEQASKLRELPIQEAMEKLKLIYSLKEN
ncbi:MAG: hypothetical protein K9W45_02750 [Candidatus Heimdallarchaeum aukensis]|uniref:Uncharacterized protein n=1 Tax=Candidatus Heimdallarchaeum aukensis TaxID=2876573 RepID=A0A9Y1BM60_9ARCH|nr:MAG: hypothetical protein K9W45_02750 [Candidatus Heimdallarchaeum aukensis]